MTPGPNCLKPTACDGKGKGADCRRCANIAINTNPELNEKRLATRRLRMQQDPAYREAVSMRVITAKARWMSVPENRERMSAIASAHAKSVLHSPAVRARAMAPEARARAGRARTNTCLAGIPIEYRPTYRLLVRDGLTAIEARKAIAEQIKVDQRRFERTGELQVAKRASNGR